MSYCRSMASLAELLDDLEDEYSDARRLVAGLGPGDPGWDVATPAAGWAVRDQISHLAFFDEAGRRGHGRTRRCSSRPPNRAMAAPGTRCRSTWPGAGRWTATSLLAGGTGPPGHDASRSRGRPHRRDALVRAADGRAVLRSRPG